MSFTNKVVIVTGGSAGIGAATVVQFAREGAKVVIVGRSEEKLQQVGKQCESLNADYLIVKADITIENDLNRIIEETIKKYGQIDILINNAGIVNTGTLLDGNLIKIYDEIMNTNLKSIVLLTSLATPHLIKTKGNIVNVSSTSALKIVCVDFIAYSISKAGLNMFTNGIALELASHGVRVNLVSPGPVKTDIMRNLGSDANIEDFAPRTALNRVSNPEELADLILFLASDKAKGITGSNYICDNGYLVKS